MKASSRKKAPSPAGERPQPHSEPEFWLFFNAHGRIGYCSESLGQLLGRTAANVKGTSVTSILPELPIRGKTPGRNVAALTMSYVNRCHALRLVLAEDWSLPVEASFRSIRLATGPVYIVELKSPGRPGTRHASALMPDSHVSTRRR